ncbi:ankyrin-3-like [Phymastichus coffea]|uniref:ankyrin-3-like n=1 Tax=Phymastichus coffea TaxID=108790 RepID=UPI00273AD52D|nr:ankyrin-3-like [Phymastichus coffea]XP_058796422.1 ankyrin-3-like [Phymastichus coffea]XP_058796423.1 ankyrin-3-like [Phymastichus coffea]
MATIRNTKNNHRLEDIVLMKNSELTRKILEKSTFRCSSETIVMKRAIETRDIENLRILLHHGRGWKTRRAIFEREICRLIDSDLKSVEFIVEHLPNLDVIDEHFIIKLRHLFEQGTHEIVEMLLKYSIDLHVKDKFGMQLLVSAFGNSKVNAIELFESRNLDVHEQGVSGETALHSAVDNNLVKNVKFLLDHGADPNSQDCVGWTPMFVVKSIECMELLLQYGADLQHSDKDGYTIFDSIQSSSDIITQAALANLAIEEARGKPVRQVIHDRIHLTENFRVFYKNCRREIKYMKKVFGADNVFLILSGDTEKVFHHVLKSDIIFCLLNQIRSMNGYMCSMFEKKLNRIANTYNVYQNAAMLAVKSNDIFDPYRSIAAKIVIYSIIEDLLVFFLIVFNSIRIFIW